MAAMTAVARGTDARAGVTGHNVRYVRLFGTLAVIVLFAIAYVVTYRHLQSKPTTITKM